MAKISDNVKLAIDELFNNVVGEECIENLIRINEENGRVWKLHIKKTRKNEITLTIRRQKRGL